MSTTQLTDTNTRTRILLIIEEKGDEVQGSSDLALALGAPNCKSFILRTARRLADDDLITICPSCGGRGRKTVYKRNRNQPGQPRKTR